MKVTPTEKKLIEAFRIAPAELKKISMKVLKGEYSDTALKVLDTVGGGIASGAEGIGDSIGETISNLFGNLLGGK